ncbi:YlbF family regulator [Hydrogenoanaerobacterium sp.]|uniref:YlbF family regulator n=1 Tax=Hydrogenoanaerobacterium sp. TaxID=2953763 RepID=UPI0028A2A0D3|nr:YlbF family regulator [Hydrogenoanaerobacterium sp.]
MDVIQLTRELGKAIQEDDGYKLFTAAKDKADNDTELQDLIGKFNLKRMDMSNAVSSQDPDQEKLEALDKELKELYDTVMKNPTMIEFNATKKAVDSMMSFINQILTASVNGEDPFTVEEASEGCSGSCGSCGGCH